MELTDEELVKEIIDETQRWAAILRRKARWTKNGRKLIAEDHSGRVTSKETGIAIAELQSFNSEEFAKEHDLEMMGLSDMLDASIRGSF